MKFKIILLLCASFFINNATAQDTITIKGKVVEATTKQPLEFVSIMIMDAITNQPISGTTTIQEGTFSVKSKRNKIYINISFIGFKTQIFKDFKISSSKIIDLKIIYLAENAQQLEEVTIRAEKSSTEFKLDKKVFNVGKDLSSTGASAIEVLNNVPSVNVNIEGQISLRGGLGAQILINGKPSVIASQEGNALGTITADQIEKIEVITNPSAKYDAEGTTGIINIVLRKNEKKGINGAISLNVGSPTNHSVGVSLNKRTENFNLFSQFGVGKRTFPNASKTYNKNKVTNDEFTTDSKANKNEQFYNLTLGTDYHINKYNVMTLSGNLTYEIEDEDSKGLFNELTNSNLTNSYNRTEVTEATNPKYEYEFQYKKDFKDNKKRNLLFSALGSFFGKDQTSEFSNELLIGSVNTTKQQSKTNFKEARYTFKLDYTHPVLDKYIIETGFQYVLNDVTNDYSVSNFLNNNWMNDAGLTNVFKYNQDVLGAYVTTSYESEFWGLKLGLRLENTNLNTELETTNKTNNQNYTNLFPSLHTSYKVSNKFSVQAGYSKRIFRPRLWDLNPFFNIRNSYNIFTGNPNLDAEFTDSYEVTSIYKLGKLNLNFGLYYRYTTNVIEDVTFFDTTTSVTTRRPENFGTSKTTGLELNYKVNFNNWISLNGDVNYNVFNRVGQFDVNNTFDFKGDRWNAKSTAKFKLPESFDLEISGNYRSKYKTAQSEIAENVFANLGLRKKIIKGKVILNMSVRDLFASRRRNSITEQLNFYSTSEQVRGRFFTFGISYGFGKGEAMEYSAQKRF